MNHFSVFWILIMVSTNIIILSIDLIWEDMFCRLRMGSGDGMP